PRRHSAAAAHQPGFVAVPYRRDAVHDHIAVALVREQRIQDAKAEIESVHHDINKHRERDDERPDGRDVDGGGHRATPWAVAPTAGVMPAAWVGGSPLGPWSPGMGGARSSRTREVRLH